MHYYNSILIQANDNNIIIFLQDGIDQMLESASDIDNTPEKVTADNIDTRQENQNRLLYLSLHSLLHFIFLLIRFLKLSVLLTRLHNSDWLCKCYEYENMNTSMEGGVHLVCTYNHNEWTKYTGFLLKSTSWSLPYSFNNTRSLLLFIHQSTHLKDCKYCNYMSINVFTFYSHIRFDSLMETFVESQKKYEQTVSTLQNQIMKREQALSQVKLSELPQYHIGLKVPIPAIPHYTAFKVAYFCNF